jgi:molybdenum ABC transporter molybdate-binding protein
MKNFIKASFLLVFIFLSNNSFAEIKVCAITQLYDALEQIKDEYQSKGSISITYASASTLYSSITNKELKCDIYLGNDTKFPIKYVDGNLADLNSITIFTKTQLALWSITGIVDKDCSILKYNTFSRIAVPDPKVNVSGFEVMRALNKMNINKKDITRKLLVANNEYSAMSFVQNGNAMLGFVPLSMLVNNKYVKDGSYCVIPKHLYDPLYYYSVTFKDGKRTNLLEIENFRGFLLQNKAKEIFKNNGFY